MDEIQCKGADDNEHSNRQKLHRRIFLEARALVRQHQIGYLYDIELLFKADRLFDVPIREQQVREIIVREALNMVCDRRCRRIVFPAEFFYHTEQAAPLAIRHRAHRPPQDGEPLAVPRGNTG